MTQSPCNTLCPIMCEENTDQSLFQGELISRLEQHADRLVAHFNQPELSDVKLIVGNREFYVSKFLLSASSTVFRTMLCDTTWSDSKKSELSLEESPECIPIFEAFLKYMYNGQITLSVDRAIPLLTLADKYNVTSLASVCEDFMMQTVGLRRNVEGAMKWLRRAEMYGLHALADLCFGVVTSNLQHAVDSPQWLQLDVESLCRILKSTETVIFDEFTLLLAVDRWLSSRYSYESEAAAYAYLQQLLPWLHFSAMSPRQIYEVENSDFGRKFKFEIQGQIIAGYRHHALHKDGFAADEKLRLPSIFHRIYLSKLQGNCLDLRWEFIPIHDAGASHTNFIVNVNLGKDVEASGSSWNLGMNFLQSIPNTALRIHHPALNEDRTCAVRDLQLRFYPCRNHANLNYYIIVALMEASERSVYQVQRLAGKIPGIETHRPHRRANFQFFQTPISCRLNNLLQSENLKLLVEVFLESDSSDHDADKYKLGPLQC